MIMDSVFSIVDAKIEAIEINAKRAAVIVLNRQLYYQMQQEMMMQDMSQKYGTVRSPHSLSVYRGIKVIPSEVIESVEVF